MSLEYRTKLIRRAVDANTSPNVAPTPLQARTLHHYFESPHCADIGSYQVIERGEWALSVLTPPNNKSNQTTYNAELAHHNYGNIQVESMGGTDGSSSGGTISPATIGRNGLAINSNRGPCVGEGTDKILHKCVRLLKTYLVVFYPSDYVLMALDVFCFHAQVLVDELSTSFEYIRALVSAISTSRKIMMNTQLGVPTGAGNAQIPSSLAVHASPSKDSNPITGPTTISLHGINTNANAASSPSSPTSRPLNSPTAILRLVYEPPNPIIPNFASFFSKLHSPSEDLSSTFIISSLLAGQIPKELLNVIAENPNSLSPLESNSISSTASHISSSASPSSTATSSSKSSKAKAGPINSSKLVSNSTSTPSAASVTAGVTSSSTSTSSTISSHSHALNNTNELSGKMKPFPLKNNHDARPMLFFITEFDIRERIETVSMSKKIEERALYRSFRRGQQLFQWKHYTGQVKLGLSQAQLDTIVSAMISPPSHESRLFASKIMIKLIMDMYSHDPPGLPSSMLLGLLMEMLESHQPIDTKIHAFNLLFNLSTHMNMYEEINFFPQASSWNPRNPPPSPTLFPTEQGSTPNISKIQRELESIFKELALVIVLNNETNRKLWFTCLSLLLYFITDSGSIDKERIQGLDVRVIAGFFRNLDYMNDSVWRHLVRILCNLIYIDAPKIPRKAYIPSANFMNQILLLGGTSGSVLSSPKEEPAPSKNKEGIKFIVYLYRRSRSMEAKDNLWTVIFDYIHYCYRRMIKSPSSQKPSAPHHMSSSNPHNALPPHGLSGPTKTSSASIADRKPGVPGSGQFQLILDLLVRLDAPQYFSTVFKYPPSQFASHVSEIINSIASQSPEFKSIKDQIDPILLRKILKDFAALGELTLKIPHPYDEQCNKMITDNANVPLITNGLKELSSFIYGFPAQPGIPDAPATIIERDIGTNWLCLLTKQVWNSKLGLNSLVAFAARPVISDSLATSTLSSSSASTSRPKSPRTSVKEAPALSFASTSFGPTPTVASTMNSVIHKKYHKESKDVVVTTGNKDEAQFILKDSVKDKDNHVFSSSKESSTTKELSREKDSPSTNATSSASTKDVTTSTKTDKDSQTASSNSSKSTTKNSPQFDDRRDPKEVKGLHLLVPDISFLDAVDAFLVNLIKSPDPLARQTYLRVTEYGLCYVMCLSDQGTINDVSKIASTLRNPNFQFNPVSKTSTHHIRIDPESLTKKAFELLNGNLLKLVNIAHEKNEINLQFMFDLILDFISIVPSIHRVYASALVKSQSEKSMELSSFSPPGQKHKTPGKSGGSAAFSSTGNIPSSHHSTPSKLPNANIDDVLTDSDESDDSLTPGDELISTSHHGGNYHHHIETPPSPQIPSFPQQELRPKTVQLDAVGLNTDDDSKAGYFMSGNLHVIRSLLNQVDITILLHIFNNLPPRMNCATRPVLLHFLIERCKDSAQDLDLVGGSAFFKKLLTENDPLLSYLASRFLIDKLQMEQPESFNTVVNTLLTKAVDLNDEKLISNPYLQIKAIFEMNHTLRRKEHAQTRKSTSKLSVPLKDLHFCFKFSRQRSSILCPKEGFLSSYFDFITRLQLISPLFGPTIGMSTIVTEVSESEQVKILEKSKNEVTVQSFHMQRALDGNKLVEALKHASNMLEELRTSLLGPKAYYELYGLTAQSLRYLEVYLAEDKHGKPLNELYELVQYAGNILQRLYLLITVGSVYIKLKKAPAKEVLKDLVEMCRGVQHPTRGLFLRTYLAEMTKDKLPELNSPYAENGGGDLNDCIEFILSNFTEMNKLWVRMQHQGTSRDRAKRERERKQLSILVGKNLSLVSSLEGVDVKLYKEVILPHVRDQIVSCKDAIAQQDLLDILIQVISDDWHLKTLRPLLKTLPQLEPEVDVKQIIVSLMERLGNYILTPEASDGTNREAIFPTFLQYITRLIERRRSMPIEHSLAMLVSLAEMAFKCYPNNPDYIDQVYSYAVQRMTDVGPELQTKAVTDQLFKLFRLPLEYIGNPIKVLDIKSYTSLALECLIESKRRRIACDIAKNLLETGTVIPNAEAAEKLFAFLRVIIADPILSENDHYDEDELAYEQNLLSAVVHRMKANDIEDLFGMLILAKKNLAGEQPGQTAIPLSRQRLTLPAIAFAAYNLVRYIIKNQTSIEGWEKKVRLPLKFAFGHIGALYDREHAIFFFKLYLQHAQAAAFAGLATNSKEAAERALEIFNEDITNAPAQFELLRLAMSTFRTLYPAFFHASLQEDWETLAANVVKLSAGLIKKADRCRAVAMCSHLFWIAEEGAGDSKFTDVTRSGKCLLNAGKTAESQDMDVDVNLFVDLLNEYLYYIEGNPDAPKRSSGIIAHIASTLGELNVSDATEQSRRNAAASLYFKNTLKHINASKQRGEGKYSNVTVTV